MEHRDRKFERWPICVSLLVALLLGSGAIHADKVYRWVDKDGNVHYTESLPPDHKDAGHDVLNERGMVVDENMRLTPQPDPEEARKSEEALANELPRDSTGLPRPKPLYTEAQKQQRMDNFLMLRYSSEQEIIDAMNVEIKQLNYDRRLIEGSQASLDEAWRGHIRIAANRERAGEKVDDDVGNEISQLRSKMAQNERELTALKNREEKIRADFQQQLDRYRFLVEKYSEEGQS